MSYITKKNILIFDLIGSIFLLILIFLGTRMCYEQFGCREIREQVLDDRWQFTFIFPLLLLFSLITYRMKEGVFQKWIKFAVWYVPLLILASFLFTGGHNGFGAGAAIGDAFDYFILFIFYAIFAIVSIVKIIRAHHAIHIANVASKAKK